MKSPTFSAQTHELVCIACNQQAHRLVGQKAQFVLWKCRQCGTISTETPVADGVLESLYDHYYDAAQFETPPIVSQSLERIVSSFASYRHTNRILDLGFGEGGLLRIAEKMGWDCYGTELSPQALMYGKERGWVVSDDTTHDARFVPAGFDVVTMIELLEHLPHPWTMLEAAARWLRPGGLLYLTTPNARSLNQRLLGTAWSVVSPPEHLVLWSSTGLRHALPKAGFQHIQIRAEGLNPFEILARFRSQAEPVNRNQAGTVLNQALSSSSARRALKTGINHLLSALQLGDGLKVYATRNTYSQFPTEKVPSKKLTSVVS